MGESRGVSLRRDEDYERYQAASSAAEAPRRESFPRDAA
jgi:hypothetical protein